ncbi:LCP family protein [Streptomyces sp. PTM05]|uniref:LCP family protein n=1 Tax=Streptantibioticus parmotrematis TaxID=2873249 RepID=A0ABS7QWE5_9ACTN|nr:LCP family protein [Streptantibioticus parmotrematis]MBY8886094.1 LCP family protein [Streptantibioticus parmotrematis]
MSEVSHRRGSTGKGGRAAVPAARRPQPSGYRSGGSGGGGRDKSGRRTWPRRLAITLSALILVVAGLGAAFYEHLNGNIKGVAISGGGAEKADAFGRTPINVLVIGSDARDTAADCKLGGDCNDGGANADVEMVLHVSADRSNATVMSVPRDTVTQLPSCTDSKTGQQVPAQTGMINSALEHGPSCQVAAVHQLTGIPIDHFMMVDFGGVVNMSDAIGGVPVCVDSNVYDTYSHLKLAKGTHTLKGVSALEFLRSRHGFGTGSDLGRTVAQHIFLSSMVRTLKSAGTLTNPSDLYGLANAATKALTVDTGLDSITKLLGFADDLNKVPSDRITFTTMQTEPSPSDQNRVVIAPAAQNLLSAIANDQSLTTGSGGKSAAAGSTNSSAPTTPPAVPDAQIAVTVENGGGITGRASDIATALVGDGFSPQTGSANAPAPTTTVRYPAGKQAEAQAVASALRIPSSALHQDSGASGVTVLIGSDWSSGTTYPAGAGGGKPAPADTKAAVQGANAQNANSSSCAQVSTFKTVEVNGVPMTPSQAYADSPDIPNSAP